MKKIFLYLFVLAGIGTLVSEIANNQLLHMICKPAIMITLALHYRMLQREQNQDLSKVLLGAIIFSCVGDILLMFQHRYADFFMFGLGAFLVSHIFYMLAYRQHQSADTSNELQGLQKIRYAFPIILSGTGLIVILYSRLGEMKIPVLIYASVLTAMVLFALFRFGKTSTSSFVKVFGGAILFMISDSLIAINKFLEPLHLAGLWIMTTYIVAQYLIVTGLSKHLWNEQNT